MKMVMIVYNEAMDTEIMEVLEQCVIKNYTKMVGVFGKGTSSGTHLGNDIWPGRNSVLFVACEEPTAKKLMSYASQLRRKLGKEGIKAFIMPIEEMT